MDEMILTVVIRENRKDIHEEIVARLKALAAQITEEFEDVHITATVYE